MEKQLRLRELPARDRQKIMEATCNGNRLGVADHRGNRIAWIVGQDDIDTLRACDRIARRFKKRFDEDLDDVLSRLRTIPRIGPALETRVVSRVKERFS